MLLAIYTFVLPVVFAQIAVGWYFIQYVLTHERGPKEPRRAVVAAAGFGVLGIALALGLELLLLPKSLQSSNAAALHRLPLMFLLLNSLLVGLIEEVSKAGPISAFIYRKPYFNEMTDGIIYFGVAGMLFGVLESIEYTFAFGLGAGIAKILTGPFTHASLTALIGYNVARTKVLKKSALTVVGGVVAAIVLHGVYDFGLFSGRSGFVLLSLGITALVNVGVFLLFARAKKLDERLGLSAVGDNLYCRHCGWPNRNHYLYCTQCGQRA